MDLSTFAAASSSSTSSFPYTQPTLPTLLIALSFLFFLNVLRVTADTTLGAGLVAELFLGMVYGAPLAGILEAQWEATFNVLGYLGLVFIIFEGESISGAYRYYSSHSRIPVSQGAFQRTSRYCYEIYPYLASVR